MKNIVIYGSYGYTGKLITRIAAGSDIPVLLSGRNEQELIRQSGQFNLPYQKASLDSETEMDGLLEDAAVVIHCAGPFEKTWKAMAEACLRNSCHYLDITGEITVFESLKVAGNRFKDKGLVALPGVGFDVVPTDCMAAYLHTLVPEAISLELAFMGLGSGISRGTARTMIENLGTGGVVRRGGHLKSVPAAYKTKTIDFVVKESSTVSIPWGDISTAYTSTGIGDITVYMAADKKMIRAMKWSNYLNSLLRTDVVKNILKRKVERRSDGPDHKQRETGKSFIWGRVKSSEGLVTAAVFQTSEGYRLTADLSWMIALKVLQDKVKPGYQTPSSLFGWELIFEHPGTKWLKKANK